MTDSSEPRDDSAAVEQVIAALGAIRGRRGPGPDGEGGGPRRGHRPPFERGELAGPGEVRHAHDERHGHARHGDHAGRGAFFGGPGAGRLGGPARVRLLEALAVAEAPLSVSEVAEAVSVDQPRASRLIQQAVDMGFARREADPDDARRTRIVLTDDGRRIARGFRGHRHDMVRTALGTFTPEERDEFVRLFTQFAGAWPQE